MGFRNPVNGIPPSSITASMLADGSVTGPKIAAGAVTADKIEATAIDGKVITGATMRTGATGKRIELSPLSNGAIGNSVKLYTGDPTENVFGYVIPSVDQNNGNRLATVIGSPRPYQTGSTTVGGDASHINLLGDDANAEIHHYASTHRVHGVLTADVFAYPDDPAQQVFWRDFAPSVNVTEMGTSVTKWGRLVEIDGYVQWKGASVTVPASGNLPDQLLGNLNHSGWNPSSIPSGVRLGHGQVNAVPALFSINTSGDIYLTALSNNALAPLAAGQNIYFQINYLI